MKSNGHPATPPVPPAHPDLIRSIQAFVIRHQSHHRPIALVTSGGTAADLEVNAVRYLDNFSTGLRGAVSAEQFLRRGYGVVHLKREGSASPFGRVLGELAGVKGANHGLSCEGLGRLMGLVGDEEEDAGSYGDDLGPIEEEGTDDPWLTDAGTGTSAKHPLFSDVSAGANGTDNGRRDAIRLSRRVLHSTRLQRTLRERSAATKDGLLLTVPFRTVDDYLTLLRICAESLKASQSLAVIYLAAAVSDFYVPKAKRSLHKIQSRDYGGPQSEDAKKAVDDDNCLTIKLHPVPKMLGKLRTEWCPDAFVVSFKLETDKTILRHKAALAARNYGVHMVIGNVLKTRHEKVWVLHSADNGGDNGSNNGNHANENGGNMDMVKEGGYVFHEISKKGSGTVHRGNGGSGTGTIDDLEDAMISFVVERHFDHIASHYPDSSPLDKNQTAMMAGAEAAANNNRMLVERKHQIQKELYWRRVRDLALNVAGSALGMALTYGISMMLQRRMFRHLSTWR